VIYFTRADTSILGRWWWTVDRWMVAAIFSLVVLGILLIMAASPAVADQHEWTSFHFIKKHLFFLVPALLCMFGVSLLSPNRIFQLSLLMFLGSLVALVMTLFMGIEIKGARRWLELGGFSLQPSEFIKPAFAVVCAWVFARPQRDPEFPDRIVAIFLYLVVAALLLMQPDLGMTLVITAIFGAEFFLAGLPILWIGMAGGVGVASVIGAYFTFPHVTRRIDHFFDPSTGDRFGDRYQVLQSLDAFMNGGFFGQGPGEGTVKKHLPDAHADFIFAVAGEEFGLILCLIIVAIFAFVVIRSLVRMLNEHDFFIVLAVTGLMIQFGLQAIINMASTLNLMPTKGMTLPFISYGGSSLIALAMGMGMVLALTRRRIQ